MGSKTLFFQLESQKSLAEVQEAASRAFMPLGGQIMQMGSGLEIKQGKQGVQFGFAADFDASLMTRESSPQHYELMCTVNWKMNALSWVCLVVGLFAFGILWIIPLLTLFIDPSGAYNTALYSVPALLNQS
jgi:hypothetical protein